MGKALFTNNATGTLASPIATTGALSLVLTAGQGALFPAPTGGNYFYATVVDASNNKEIVKVTANAADTFTIVRGQESTTARTFASGSRVELRPTAAGLNEKYASGDSASFSALAVAGTVAVTVGDVSISNNLSVGGASLGGNAFAVTGNAGVSGDFSVGVNLGAATITSGNYVRANGFGITMEMNYAGIASTGGAGSNIDCIAQGSGGVRLSAGATAWAVLSDETLKTPFVPFTDALEKVAKIRAGTGRYFTDAEGVSRSFLSAQSVQAVLPEAINVRTSFGEVADPLDGKLMLSYTDVIPLLVAALAEANARIIALENA